MTDLRGGDDAGADRLGPEAGPDQELREVTEGIAEVRDELTTFDTDPDYRNSLLAQYRAERTYELARLSWQRYLLLDDRPDVEPDDTAAALRTAMESLQQARAGLPTDSELGVDLAWWLGGGWTERYLADADPAALDQVIRLAAEVAGAGATVPGAVGPARHRLAEALLERHGLAADPDDLHRAAAEAELALRQDPTGDPEAESGWWYGAMFTAGMARARRWIADRQRDDLDAAIGHLDRLATADPQDGPDPATLSGLARMYHDRAALLTDDEPTDRTAAASDLTAGQRWVRIALDRCGADDPARPGILAARALLSWARYRGSGQLDDLVAAEPELTEAVEAQDGSSGERETLLAIRAMLVAERTVRGVPHRPTDGATLDQAYAGMWQEYDRVRQEQAGAGSTDVPAEPVLPPLPPPGTEPPPEQLRGLLDQAIDAWSKLPARAPERARFAAMLVTTLMARHTRQHDLLPHPRSDELVESARTAYPDDAGWQQRLLAFEGMLGVLRARQGDTAPLDDGLAAMAKARRLAADSPSGTDLDIAIATMRQVGAQLTDDLGGTTRAIAEHADIAARPDLTEQQRSLLHLQDAAVRVAHGLQHRDRVEVDSALAELRAELAQLPEQDPRRTALTPLLTMADLWQRAFSTDRPDPAVLEQVAEQLGTMAGRSGAASLADLDVYAMLARAGAAVAGYDQPGLERQIAQLRQRIDQMPVHELPAITLRIMLAGVYMMRLEAWRTFADADRAVEELELVRPYVVDPTHQLWSAEMSWLSRAYRARDDRTHDDRARSREAGLQALRGYAWRTLVQSGTAEAALASRDVLDDATEVFDWCVSDNEPAQAVRALDACRGLVLQAASHSRDLPALLLAAGQPELADRWRSGSRASGPIPAGLRQQVMRTLFAHERSLRIGGRIELLDPPEPAEITDALRSAGADALVYLVPATSERPPIAVLVPANGEPEIVALPMLAARFSALDGYLATRLAGRRVAAGARDAVPPDPSDGAAADPEAYQALRRLSDWAWYAAMEQILQYCARREFSRPYRLVLVPMGPFGLVPWHAARAPGGRYVISDAVLSYAASARMFCGTIRREPVRTGADSLIVGDPTGDLVHAEAEASAIRSTFHPAAPYLGRPGSGTATGPASPAELLSWLESSLTADRGVLHLACHGVVVPDGPERSYLVLAGSAGPTPLTAERISETARRSEGGFQLAAVVLAACSSAVPGRAYDEAYSLATVFLMAGARSVVGSLWPVPDEATSLLMYMLHHYLAVDRMGPAQALRLAQLWMLDPDRGVPAGMPATLRSRLAAIDPDDLGGWAGFNHLGQW
ncbi:CHAT domain-containing protein [Plantactinospora soyae]|uniref:CHAT domain-containing protein n=1 Tax=Plantactinospora soyae TaxID=1544732 RepID=A0A927MBY6_9ACTN|nr:CHAT domain-containing protein [Plantactinospora soyae]MBE1491928.1 hypothetical protein [Plantactinospora soyae]